MPVYCIHRQCDWRQFDNKHTHAYRLHLICKNMYWVLRIATNMFFTGASLFSSISRHCHWYKGASKKCKWYLVWLTDNNWKYLELFLNVTAFFQFETYFARDKMFLFMKHKISIKSSKICFNLVYFNFEFENTLCINAFFCTSSYQTFHHITFVSVPISH